MRWDIDTVSKYLPTKHLLIIYMEKSNHTLEVLDKHHINQVIKVTSSVIRINQHHVPPDRCNEKNIALFLQCSTLRYTI